MKFNKSAKILASIRANEWSELIMMGWLDSCSGFQGGSMMMLGMFIFWGGLLFLGFYLLKKYLNGNNHSYQHSINILNERFAKGEISEKEYDHLKAKIRNK
ncbi:SHOCT domain-containing protein [Cytobacillus sp. IB215316]|uniref:SHOCT domain-containing protein n=1 Tax=Cytobacillus sp. IB215316 TaxID=3097354 RepID=UPI002A13F417|nr:SHOCT domain-containing protein [Cytobacillus sp. IB215316]MDX8362481.1 SHOCT domain-containing protein [Cytobacillus sp. IB215316]